jgi:hypothetical protein
MLLPKFRMKTSTDSDDMEIRKVVITYTSMQCHNKKDLSTHFQSRETLICHKSKRLSAENIAQVREGNS